MKFLKIAFITFILTGTQGLIAKESDLLGVWKNEDISDRLQIIEFRSDGKYIAC